MKNVNMTLGITERSAPPPVTAVKAFRITGFED